MSCNKVFVISDERCGGTQLGNFFQFVGYRRVDDPQSKKPKRDNKIFNKHHVLGNFKYFADNYDYIKICMISFSFDEYKKIIQQARKSGFKFIFLWRKNYLQRAVSKAIAKETNCWSQHSVNKKWEGEFRVDTKLIGEEIERNKTVVRQMRDYLAKDNIQFYDLEFSNLYGGKMKTEDRYKKLCELFDSLDINIRKNLSQNIINKIKERLSPQRRINNSDTYKRIINISEIKKKFSNKENGVLM